jgi:hypothetical protein
MFDQRLVNDWCYVNTVIQLQEPNEIRLSIVDVISILKLAANNTWLAVG